MLINARKTEGFGPVEQNRNNKTKKDTDKAKTKRKQKTKHSKQNKTGGGMVDVETMSVGKQRFKTLRNAQSKLSR